MQNVSLEDKYELNKGRIFVNGTQVLVKLPFIQKKIDKLNSLNTSGFISGYRGSPLGAYDKALWQAKTYLKKNDIMFSPGLNEDLAATAVWGTQQPNLISDSNNDGVFSIWYGKGPGVDRSGDAFKHGNSAGTSKNGGVLLLLGDDHTAKSSTLAHQSEYAMLDAQIPILNPSNLQDLLEYGIFGWHLSRFSGLWVSLKCITTTIDSSSSIDIDISKLNFQKPAINKNNGNVNIRIADVILEQETRITDLKIPAAINFATLNNINKVIFNEGKKHLGIISTGKAFSDTMDCLKNLNIDQKKAEKLGIHLLKIGMTWPLESKKIEDFSRNMKEIIVIEEKRAFLETNIKNILYNKKNMPKSIVGKLDENGNRLIKEGYEINKTDLKFVLISRIEKTCKVDLKILSTSYQSSVKKVSKKNKIERTPYFCSGCPHNTSTKVPDGSKAMAGIGCHFMAAWMNRKTSLFTHMGAEGANWIGMAPFVKEKHIFQNIGDGTFNHSGTLAIRAAVNANVNITYKILYNDAVAMTGGQPVDGMPTTEQITHQLYGEGVNKIAIVTDEVLKYKNFKNLAKGTSIHDRKELDKLQKQFRTIKGVTVIIYDQTCATEKRRRRKRGLLEDPNKRIFINHLVCEGCGDCSVESNCISVEPMKTIYGTKRKINQSTCNKDYSCAGGFCPSFTEIKGGTIIKKFSSKISDPDNKFKNLKSPKKYSFKDNEVYNILVTGIGGTGVVTIGALIGMAAHIEKKGITVLDQVGIAQKGGAVLSHIKLAKDPSAIHSPQISDGTTNLLLGCDMVVSASNEINKLLNNKITNSVINNHEAPLSQSVLDPNYSYSGSLTKSLIKNKSIKTSFLNATELAKNLFGDTILSNIFLVGYAFQKGLIPISLKALKEAIKLNAINIEENISAFSWGRLASEDINHVLEKTKISDNNLNKKLPLSQLINKRYQELIKYQDEKYAAKYLKLIKLVQKKELALKEKNLGMTKLVVNTLYKIMAYKDEFEVARLYTDGRFKEYLKENFEGAFKIGIYLSPPILNLIDKKTNKPKKILFSSKVFVLFKILNKFKFLRNTFLNPFRYSTERKKERELIKKFENNLNYLLNKVNKTNYKKCLEILNLFNNVKGYGHVKMNNFKEFEIDLEYKLSQFKASESKRNLAAE
jgi:indolepyruvate ferredoxin oxidoreductase